MSLEEFGWSDAFVSAFEEYKAQRSADEPEIEPARVTFFSYGIYRVQTESGERVANLAGRFLQEQGQERPAVGDWVVVDGGEDSADADMRLVQLLPRVSKLSRKVPGDRAREQIVAANIDAVFLVMGMDGDFNLRRLERFLAMIHESGAEPVIVLTKMDLTEEAGERRLEAMEVAPGVPVHIVCSPQKQGLEPLHIHLGEGKTVALVGTSGAGKSTLLNHLCGDELMRTGGTRESDDRGRHTTTHRELVRLPHGGLLIDNPGIREIQVWSDEEKVVETFSDIQEFANACRFSDCKHESEPGCGVQAAISEGSLSAERLENMRTLNKEQRYLELRQDEAARRKADRKLGMHYKKVIADKSRKRKR